MLFGKKKKISMYLLEKKTAKSLTPFDSILSEYLVGKLKENLCKLNMEQIDIYIDWLFDYKCINIQGKVIDYFFDIQIEPTSFSIAYDKDEPDEGKEFVLQDVASFYSTIEDVIMKTK